MRFSAYGERHEITADTDSEVRARAQLDEILRQIKQGVWEPPTPSKPVPPRAAEPTFGEFAAQWFQGIAPSLKERGREDYLWALNQHLLPYFTERLLSEITPQMIDDYRQAKVREGKLGPTSINKTITRLAQILDLAVEYGHLQANPARGKRRRMKAPSAKRTYLEPEQVLAVLDAAGELDHESTYYSRKGGRRAIMASLMLTGVRVSELCDLKWGDLDLVGRKLYVRDAKTEAGVRVVPMSAFLHDELTAYKADAIASQYAFPTATGNRRDKDNVRNRVHNPVIKRTNENLERDERPLIQPGTSPHALRRTFISLLLEAGENVRNVMAYAGHSTPNITLAIYGQVLTNPGSRNIAHKGSSISVQ